MVWTKNEYGKPHCWVDPSHKVDQRDPTIGKEARFGLAMDILEWFHGCADYLDPDNWGFKVDSEGKYLPGEPKIEKPAIFTHQSGSWSLTLRVPSSTPRRRYEAETALETLHKTVTVVIMQLVGSSKAGKLLAAMRQQYDLPKLQKASLIGKQGLLF